MWSAASGSSAIARRWWGGSRCGGCGGRSFLGGGHFARGLLAGRVWRADLPAGPQLRAAAMSRLRVWAGYLDPDFSHSQRVAQLALLLYDGLKDVGLMPPGAGNPAPVDSAPLNANLNMNYDSRAVLQAAALMHDVGKAKGAENHQKRSYRMIRGLARPVGWSARELELAAVVARYHR